jgi:hypothetical protein
LEINLTMASISNIGNAKHQPQLQHPNPQTVKLIYVYSAKFGLFQNQVQLQHYLRNSISLEEFQQLEQEIKLRSSAFIIHSLLEEQNTLYDNVETVVDNLFIMNTEATSKLDSDCNSVVFQLDLKLRLVAIYQPLLKLKHTYPPATIKEISTELMNTWSTYLIVRSN